MKSGCITNVIDIILVITGTFVANKPYMAWYFLIGWQIQDAEPTDLALFIYRILAFFTLPPYLKENIRLADLLLNKHQ